MSATFLQQQGGYCLTVELTSDVGCHTSIWRTSCTDVGKPCKNQRRAITTSYMLLTISVEERLAFQAAGAIDIVVGAVGHGERGAKKKGSCRKKRWHSRRQM